MDIYQSIDKEIYTKDTCALSKQLKEAKRVLSKPKPVYLECVRALGIIGKISHLTKGE
jgi:hypothetical protein